MAKRGIRPKRLYRSEKDRMIAGVAGGLAQYFQIDSSLIRLLFVISTFAGGLGFWVYLVLWIILPTESSVKKKSEKYMQENVEELKTKAERFAERASLTEDRSNQTVIGLIIVLIGSVFLLANFGFSLWRYIWRLWPFILIAFGIYFLIKREDEQ